jgi:hypothetical protein
MTTSGHIGTFRLHFLGTVAGESALLLLCYVRLEQAATKSASWSMHLLRSGGGLVYGAASFFASAKRVLKFSFPPIPT